ncbi:MAG: N-acetyltransferase [Oscillospiraceae bacterium]|nr:N-acetyltransferase [Oscillospiraceae bacterium]
MTIRKALQKDLPAMLEIYNYEVLNSTATMDIHPKTLEERQVWFDEHNTENHPLIVAEIDGKVVGYASLSRYSEKEAYRRTVELSVYIDKEYRERGIASALMEYLIEEAKKDPEIHTIVSVITGENQASVNLHEKFGFSLCGRVHEVGKKFGRYLDIINYELIV